ncbi:MAG: hypothetical protein IJT73_00930 [Selenomonadaceae bacterium]|nr:hypothetical protein [Selenomonadaceae bacterium]
MIQLVFKVSNSFKNFVLKIDEKAALPMFKISETHYAATWLLHPDAPKVQIPPELQTHLERSRKAAGL